MKVAKVENHYSPEEFKKLFNKYKNNAIVYVRLKFIKSLINGNTIKDTAKILDISTRTGTEWLRRYNEYGVEGLEPKFHLRGIKSKLSDEQMMELYEVINKEGNSFSIKDAQRYISNEFSIDYSYKQVWEITRKKMDFNYGKPFLKYKEHPENYKKDFKKN